MFFRDIDNIDSLMDDITEQQQIAQEISGAISQPFGDQFDEVINEIIMFLKGWVGECGKTIGTSYILKMYNTKV